MTINILVQKLTGTAQILIDDFISQRDLIENFETDNQVNDCYSTHPLNPLRISALKNFWNSESFINHQKNKNSKKIKDEEMDEKIFEILNFMEPKKNPKVDLEKKRGLFMQIGLAISLLIVLGAFEYRTYEKVVASLGDLVLDAECEDIK